ncbi:hypothetical protein [uncultured Slackia sp.]|uniref:VG15 protein n=1 Tax=uncultured Slackia sp. TaxID=665903 RepID=UPI0026E0FC6D|nr:hypothetical protein [uncultured Slackia sp.]
MATIPRAALDFLAQQVNAISADAQAKVLEVLEAIEWTPDNVARCREIVAEALASVLPAYADASAQAAADFYDAARELCAGEAIGAAALSRLDMGAVQGAVRALVQVVVDGGAKERFDREVLGRVDVEMKKAAANSIVENAAKDPAKPRWARVPSGRETCPFCLMLASFGFNTWSKEAASHTHANCDCRIVPQWDEGSVEGYDPDGMYDRYNACLDAIGGRDGVRREWDALPKEERDAYVAKHGGRAGDALDAFLSKRVSAEIGRRDPEWFMTGKVPDTDYSLCPRDSIGRFSAPESYERHDLILVRSKNGRLVEPPEWRDLFVHDSLRNNGIAVVVRPSSAVSKSGKVLQGVTNPDIEMDGAMWDIKSPRCDKRAVFAGKYDEKKATQFVEDAFRSAIGNFRNPYDCGSMAGAGDKTAETRLVLSLRYRNDGVPFEHIERRARLESKALRVKEFIIVKKDGNDFENKKRLTISLSRVVVSRSRIVALVFTTFHFMTVMQVLHDEKEDGR